MGNNIEKIYDESLEDWPFASEDTRNTYNGMNENSEKYICSLQKTAFIYGYELGFSKRLEIRRNV